MRQMKRLLALFLCAVLIFASIPQVYAQETDPAAQQATEEPANTAEPTLEPTPELTPEPTVEPTVEPAAEPTAEPTAAPTATPAANSEPTQEPTAAPDPTAEPTAAPTATPKPEGSSFNTAFLLVKDREMAGEITAEFSVLYYQLTVNSDGEYEFRSGGNLPIKAALMEGKLKELETFEPNVVLEEGKDPEQFFYTASLDKDKTYYLVVESWEGNNTGRFTLMLTKQPEPTQEPTPEPASEPTVEPTVEPTIETTAEPAATAEPTATPMGKEPVEQPVMPVGILEATGTQAQSSFTPAGELKINGYPESAHPYTNYLDSSWFYSVEDAIELYINFSYDTFLENGYDYVYIYDYDGDIITFTDSNNNSFYRFTGSQLANSRIHIGSSGFHIRLTSDGSMTTYGFQITNVEPVFLQAPVLQSCEIQGNQSVALSWTSVAKAETYIVCRKEGSGEYDVVEETSNLSTVDNTVLSGKTYTYTVVSAKYMDGVYSISPFSNTYTVSILGTPQAPSLVYSESSGVAVSWNSIPGAQGYIVSRAGVDGVYQQIADLTGTLFQDTSAIIGNIYTYKISAYAIINGLTITTHSPEVTILTIAIPAFLSGDQYGTNSAMLSWNAVTGAAGYEMYRSTSAGGTYTLIGTLSDLSAEDINLTAGQTYYYKLRAYVILDSVSHYTPYSPVRSVGILGKSVFSAAAAQGDTNALLQWSAISGAVGYTLYSSLSTTGPYSEVKSLTGTSTELTGLTKGNVYFFKLAAYKMVNELKVYGVPSEPVSMLMMAAPAFITGEQSGVLSAKFTWSALQSAGGYSLWRATSANGTYTEVGTTTATTIEANGLNPGQLYFFKLRCFKTVEGIRYYGAISASKSVQILAKAAIVTLQGISATNATIKWNAVPGAKGYTVYRATTQTGTYSAVLTVTGTSANISGMSVGKLYYFKVAAYKDVGGTKIYGASSDIKYVLIMMIPVIKTLNQSKATNALITWGSVTGASGYVVYRSTSVTGTFAAVKTLTGTSCEDSGLAAGTTYYYKIKAYKLISNVKYYTEYSAVKTVQTLAKPLITTLNAQAGSTATVKWNTVSGASGYTLYRATSKTGTYTAVKTVTAASADSTGLTPGGTYYFKVAAYRLVSNKKVYGVLSDPANVTAGWVSGGKYRALLIGQKVYTYANDLNGDIDAMNMASMLGKLKMGTQSYQCTVLKNAKGSSILSYIPSTFSGATANDVSLFYYSGHGDNGTGKTAGALVGVDSVFVTPLQLRNTLDKIPGKIIVILDSCGSGAAIYQKSANAKEVETTKEDASRFNQSFISAFSGGTAKTGELRASKYIVLTACEYGKTSVEYVYPGQLPYGAFTRALCRAGGWDGINLAQLSLLADSNKDTTVTLKEAYSYIRSFLSNEEQVLQAYPSNCTYPLFKR